MLLRKLVSGRQYVQQAAMVKRDFGVAYWQQMLDLLRLHQAGAPLTLREYYALGAYRRDMSFTEKRGFVGLSRAKKFFHAPRLHDLHFRALVTDKTVIYALLQQIGVTCPHTQAIFGSRARRLVGARRLEDESALMAWLQNDAEFPLYCKPAAGRRGAGQMRMMGYNAATGRFDTSDGQLTAEQVIDAFRRAGEYGVLLQSLLQPDPALESLAGKGLAGLRVVVCRGKTGGYWLHRAVLKIPKAGSINDNWSTGNYICSVNLDSGALGEVVEGEGLARIKHAKHPVSGAPMTGETLPNWDEIKAGVLRSAGQFSGLNIQGWDVALTANGPVFLEVNFVGGIGIIQAADSRPYIDENMVALFREYGGESSVLDPRDILTIEKADALAEQRYHVADADGGYSG